MRQGSFTIAENRALTETVFCLRLQGDTGAMRQPGQFAALALPGFYLRRPLSVCDWTEGELTILYKVVGAGTRTLSALPCGTSLDLLTGLGHGFSLELAGEHPVLVGGGVGVPPLYGLARRLLAEGKTPRVLLGFPTARDAFYQAEFIALGCAVTLVTEDGTAGVRGLVTEHLPPEMDSLYACGPLPMLKALYHGSDCPAEFSLEERMGCGFGACMGCSCETKEGSIRICREGPVVERGKLLWQTPV